jgi:anaerobic selenocysteine-containing dehydrogenase
MPRHSRICTLCEATCGLLLEVDHGEVLDVQGDPRDPLSGGYLCAKGKQIGAVYDDPRRLRTPMARRGEEWVSLDWDEALDEVAHRLAAIQREHGRDAVATYLGNPAIFDYGTFFFSALLFDAIRSRNRYSAGSLDGLPHLVAAYEMFGNQLLLPVPDVDRTDLLVIVGGNPLVSNGSMMTSPGFAQRAAALRSRGGRLIVIDPRRTETAALADEHLPIRPGADPALLLAVLRLLLPRTTTLKPAVKATLTRIAAPFDLMTAARITGLAEAAIVGLAEALRTARTAAVYPRIGVAHQQFSTLTCWLANVVNLVTGNLDQPGGAMFTRPAVDLVRLAALTGRKGGFGDPTRTGLPSFAGERPTAALADEMAMSGPGRIRALITLAGNLTLSAPNGRKLATCLPDLELFVAIDPFLNDTTRHAHFILPPAPGPARDQYGIVTMLTAIKNVARYNEATADVGPGEREEWRILNDLHRRIAARRSGPVGLFDRASAGVTGLLGPRGLLAIALLVGPHGLRRLPRRPLTLGYLRRHPEGVDLGPLVPMLRRRRARVRVAPPRLVDEAERALAELDSQPPADTLRLIGRRQRSSLNSWLRGERDKPLLLVHPDDAASRGIVDGASVVATTGVGSVRTQARVTDEMAPGVVSLPHGHSGVSLNDLTDETRVDRVSATAALSGIDVTIAPGS